MLARDSVMPAGSTTARPGRAPVGAAAQRWPAARVVDQLGEQHRILFLPLRCGVQPIEDVTTGTEPKRRQAAPAIQLERLGITCWRAQWRGIVRAR